MVLTVFLLNDKAPPVTLHGSPKETLTGSDRLPQATDLAEFLETWKTTPAQQAALLKDAQRHRDQMLERMKTRPDQALSLALSFSEHAALPDELKPFFAKPFSAAASIDQLWAVSELPDGTRHCESRNSISIGTDILEATSLDHTLLPILDSAPVSGIRLASQAVVSNSTVLKLSEADVAAIAEQVPANERIDPLTGAPGTEPTLIGGEIYYLSSKNHIQQIENTLEDSFARAKEYTQRRLEHPYEWLSGSAGGDSGTPQETPYQENQIDVLFIRVDFSDFPGEPITQAALQTTLNTVDGHLGNYSYNEAGITATVSNSVYRMPSTGATYAQAGDNSGIQTDARALASADYTLSNYDVIAVYFPNLSGVPNSDITYGGLASVGGGNHWINGVNSVGVILHEFGHNYGLYHANYEIPGQEISGLYQLPGILEYGDIFDEMGSGNSPEGHFSHLAKNLMQWMPDSKVMEATGDGIFTIYRFDDVNAISNPTLAVKVPMAGDVNYWIGYRQLYTSSSFNLQNAAYVVAENLAQNRETTLIDMTPESQSSETADRRDAGLPVGSSFYEPGAGVRFTALERGGSSPNEWIRVQVQFDSRISLKETSISVDEQCGTASIIVERNFAYNGAVSVNYATTADTATVGTDYYDVSGTLTWADGDTSDRTITVPIRPDLINESNETFTLTLSNIVGGTLDSGSAVATVSILDAGQRLTDFAPGFFNNVVNAALPLASGDVIIGGNIAATSGDFQSITNIARLNPDGSVDSSFITGSGFNGEVEAMALQSDGKIIVGGAFTSYNGSATASVARLNPNGSLDTSFSTAIGTGPNATPSAVAVEANGKILIGGSFTSFNGTPATGLIRLTATGTVDTTDALNLPFNPGISPEILAILAEPSGTIMVGGSFYISATGTGFRSGLARLNADGSRDTSFDPDAGAHADGSVSSVRRVYTIAASGEKYVIGGSFTAYDENAASRVARVNSDGSFDNTFSPPAFNNIVRTLLVQPSGSVLVGGSFTSPSSRLEGLTSTGAINPAFNQGAGPSGTIYSLTSAADGSVFVGGNFFNYAGDSSRPIVQISGGISPYDLWVQQNFSSSEIANGDADPNADPDLDGAVNLVEMALGTDPGDSSSTSEFYVAGNNMTLHESGGQNYLQATLNRSTLTKGTWFTAQFTSDFETWSPSTPTPGASASYIIVEDLPTRMVIRDVLPTSATEPRFVRFALMRPE